MTDAQPPGEMESRQSMRRWLSVQNRETRPAADRPGRRELQGMRNYGTVTHYGTIRRATGLLDNLAFNGSIANARKWCSKIGQPYEGPSPGNMRPGHQKNPVLAGYMDKLTAKVAMPDAEEEFDPTAPSKNREPVKRNPQSDMKWQKLYRRLVEHVPQLIREGLDNAIGNHKSSSRAIPQDEPIPGLETVGGDGRAPFSLTPYQREAVGRWEYLQEKYQAAILADDMGLGKTITIISILQRARLRAEEAGRHIIAAVVTPPTLISTWLAEFDRVPELRVGNMALPEVAQMTSKELHGTYDVLLVPNDLVSRLYREIRSRYCHWHAVKEGVDGELQDLLRKAKPSSGGYLGPEGRVEHALLGLHFDQVIVEEAHHIKNTETHLHRGVRMLRTRGRGVLTGTPIQNSPLELLSLFEFLEFSMFSQPELFKTCFVRKRMTGKDLTQDTVDNNTMNDALLAAIRSAITIRRTKDQVFDGAPILQMPPCDQVHVTVRLSTDSCDTQKARTRDIWDSKFRKRLKRLRKEDPEKANSMFQSRDSQLSVLADITYSRLHLIHPLLPRAKYNDQDALSLEAQHAANPDLQDLVANMIRNDTTTTHDTNDPLNSSCDPEDADANDPDAEIQDGQVRVDPTAVVEAIDNDEEDSKLQGAARIAFNKSRQSFLKQFRQPGNEDLWKSDRILALVEHIHKIVTHHETEAAKIADPVERKVYLATHKTIVVSDWLAGLDIIEIGLTSDHKWGRKKVLLFDGSLSHAKRDEIRCRFQEVGKDFTQAGVEPDEHQIMLVSTKAGHEGINLFNATDVVVVAPAWNPSIEDQTIGRAHRKGQENRVTVHRFHSQHSIEGRITSLQGRKRQKTHRIMDDQWLLEAKQANKLDDAIDNYELLMKIMGKTRLQQAVARGTIRV